MSTTRGKELMGLGLRALACAWCSAEALLRLPGGQYWGAGLAFALLILPLRFGWRPPLIAAVTLSHALGVASMDWLPPQDALRTYLQAPLIGSLALALSLRWLGAVGWRRAGLVLASGGLLGPWFWVIIGSGEMSWLGKDLAWVLAFLMWQAPMAVILTYRRKDDTLGGITWR